MRSDPNAGTVDPEAARRRMVDGLEARGILHDHRVREALLAIPREAFSEDAPYSDAPADASSSQRIRAAYEDAPQPIGEGQTISAPHMVAMMAEALDVRPGQRVLEVGGGSGYHAAVLARLCAPGEVVSIEIVAQLAQRAQRTLRALGIENVRLVEADGSEGYPALAPYDRISVAAGAPAVPEPLVRQLAPGGSMVIPVGPLDEQTLLRVDARGESTPLMAVRFVPLRGTHGWKS